MTPAPRRRRGVSGKFRRPAAVGDSAEALGAGSGTAPELDAAHDVQDWHGITAGLSVQVHLPGGFSFQGTVDAKTADSSVVWIKSDAGLRQMFGHLEGVRLSPQGAGTQ